MKATVIKFPKNEKGSDYVVGDIHGEFDILDLKLNEIGFDPTKDRLFSVGDLVDRGRSSADCLAYLDLPWFHAVRGNHEDMLIQFYDGEWGTASYIDNGGEWFFKLSYEERGKFVNVFRNLPHAFEIETDNGRVGIVHAEVPDNDWNTLYERDLYEIKAITSWSRTKIRSSDTTPVANIDRVYVGHTVLKEPIILGNVYYIDTGAVFYGKLTIVKL